MDSPRWQDVYVSLLIVSVWTGAAGCFKLGGLLEASPSRFPFVDIEINYSLKNRTNQGAVTVLLLNGGSQERQEWFDAGVANKLYADGMRVMTVDLPGYGLTPRLPYLDGNMRAEVVREAFLVAGGSRHVLVSPGISGVWAVAYLERYSLDLDGWVVLCPEGLQQWMGPPQSAAQQVRMLAVCGDQHAAAKQVVTLRGMFEHGTEVLLPNVSLPIISRAEWHLQQPDAFLSAFSAFLTLLPKPSGSPQKPF